MKIILNYIREGRNYIIALLVLVSLALWLLFYLGSPVGGSMEPITVVVPKGSSAGAVGSILKNAGLIRSSMAFAFIARATYQSEQIKPGAYRFTKTMSLRKMLDIITKGDVSARWITIPEGFTARQIAQRLDKKRVVNGSAFLALTDDSASGFSSILDIPAQGLEGYLFPDTYLFPIGADPKEVASQMLETFKSKVANRFAPQIAKMADGNSPAAKAEALHKIIIIASMIEREARIPKDRPLISAVIWNRLKCGMRLNIDATVQYALGEHRDRLYYRDLAVESPYNTYIHAGLPIGPISNPGLASVEAALHPADADYLYYVARSDGSHVFSRTLQEHNAAKARIKNGSL